MLHAIARPGKSKRDRAIHAFRVEKTSVADKFYEDEVTSSVLGPLVFLQAEDVQLIWQALLPDLAVLRGNGVADHCEVRLWDRRKIKGQPGTVEPDVRFDFCWHTEWGEKKHMVLLEVKWRAAVGHIEQMHRQWQEYLTAHERDHCTHVLLTQSTRSLDVLRSYTDNHGTAVWMGWSWFRLAIARLAEQLQSDGKGNTPLCKWARLVDVFLGEVGIHRFTGLASVCKAFAKVGLPERGWVFFNSVTKENVMEHQQTTAHGMGKHTTEAVQPANVVPTKSHSPNSGLDSGDLDQSLINAFYLIQKASDEVINMYQSYKELMSMRLSQLLDSDVGFDVSDWDYQPSSDEDGWTFPHLYWNTQIGERKEKKYLSIQVSFIENLMPEKNFPIVYVVFSTAPIDLKSEYWGFPFDEAEKWKIEGQKLMRYDDGSSWAYALKLTDIKDQTIIEKSMVEPALALYLGKSVDEALPDDVVGLVKLTDPDVFIKSFDPSVSTGQSL